MSSYIKEAINPKTGKEELAYWIDDYFGHNEYGVRFADGSVYRPEQITKAEKEEEHE